MASLWESWQGSTHSAKQQIIPSRGTRRYWIQLAIPPLDAIRYRGTGRWESLSHSTGCQSRPHVERDTGFLRSRVTAWPATNSSSLSLLYHDSYEALLRGSPDMCISMYLYARGLLLEWPASLSISRRAPNVDWTAQKRLQLDLTRSEKYARRPRTSHYRSRTPIMWPDNRTAQCPKSGQKRGNRSGRWKWFLDNFLEGRLCRGCLRDLWYICTRFVGGIKIVFVIK